MFAKPCVSKVVNQFNIFGLRAWLLEVACVTRSGQLGLPLLKIMFSCCNTDVKVAPVKCDICGCFFRRDTSVICSKWPKNFLSSFVLGHFLTRLTEIFSVI